MIQRIQTIFLFVASILMFLTTLFPISNIFDAESPSITTLYAFKIDTTNSLIHHSSISTITSGIALYACSILGFAIIFLYKKRKLQMLFTSIEMVFTFLSCNLIVINSYRAMPSPHASLSFTFFSIFPIVSLILYFLAYKAIKKDDKLVKSLDRIR